MHKLGGVSPLQGVEAALEWLAYRSLSDEGRVSPIKGELTGQRWEEVCSALTDALSLPSHIESSASFAHRMPGLFEHTRRIADALAPDISRKSGSSIMSAILAFMMRAPQTGLRRTEVGAYVWPEYLAELFPALLGKPTGKPVYVPYDSSGWLPLLLAESGWAVDTEIRNKQIARIFGLFGYLAGWKLTAHVGDPLYAPSLRDGDRLTRFANAAAILTFGLRVRDGFDPYNRFPVRMLHGEARQIAHLLAQSKGRVLAIVPEGFLFRAAGGERDYKEHLIRGGILAAVIRLPRGALAPFTQIQTSMLVLESEGRKSADVLFVDASDELAPKDDRRRHADRDPVAQVASMVDRRRPTEISVLAEYDAIAAQDFNISVDRYVRSDEVQRVAEVIERAQTVELSDIAEIIRPQSFPSEGGERVARFAEVGLQDIEPDGQIRRPAKRTEIDEAIIAKILKQRLAPGDLLVSVRGRIGAVGMVQEAPPDDEVAGWLASQAFVVVRLREISPISQLTLYRYLASPLGQGLLQSLSTGATVPMVSMGDMKKLRIMVPTAKEQREIESQYEKLRKLRDQIRKLEALTEELNAAVWPMTRAQ
ncbi:MAG TPA: N-6 DNA methylase [Hyphomicrobiaceae bacterium]|nr:N-6 DNA methylase [Hyphomicrobiaceae bacterium]